ncbi:transcriptional regulator [Lysinibacillus sp. ZYM-1]|uniref:transcriptional regulator n=1 Tax=Lysinibacillus sp. ZYM-1 TaxID=1681184 RepID=UPI000B1101AF|nr:transcriptional regulator [Lysinibacillus sp. ZYM-1]
MKGQLIKAIQHNQLVNMMYILKSGFITKRCIPKQAKRTFIIDNVLAIVSVVYKKRGII